ncbi:conserved hypothetical protein [Gammaproteobacteria bacterium]
MTQETQEIKSLGGDSSEDRELLAIETALADPAANKTEAALELLRQKFIGIIIDCSTPAGDKDARESRRMLVSLRTTGDKKRLDLNRPEQAKIDLRNAEWKRIAAVLQECESPLDRSIKAEEARKAEIKAEKERQAQERAARFQERLDKLRNYPLITTGYVSAQLEESIEMLERQVIGADWEEFEAQAEQLRCEVIGKIREQLAAALAKEQEAAQREADRLAEEERHAAERKRLAEQQAELDKQREQMEAANRKQAMLTEIANLPANSMHLSSQGLQGVIDHTNAHYQDPDAEIVAALARTFETLTNMRNAKAEQEAEAERLRLHQEELDAQEKTRKAKEQAEQAERDRMAKEKAEQEAEELRKAELERAREAHEAQMNAATADHLTTLRSILAATEDSTLSAPAALQLISELAKRGIANLDEARAAA